MTAWTREVMPRAASGPCGPDRRMADSSESVAGHEWDQSAAEIIGQAQHQQDAQPEAGDGMTIHVSRGADERVHEEQHDQAGLARADQQADDDVPGARQSE